MKSQYFLSRLVIEGFRGINNEGTPLDLHFRPDVVNSIFAANGIGKSSIFEALDYAVHGRIKKLHELHSKEQAKEYYANHFHSKRTSTIQLEFTSVENGEVVSLHITRDSEGNRTVTNFNGDSELEIFLEGLREDFILLDGRTFNNFIEDTPLDRGRNFSSLIGLQKYSKCSQALRVVSRRTNLNTDLGVDELSKSVESVQREIDEVSVSLATNYKFIVGEPIGDVGQLSEKSANVVLALSNVEPLKDHLRNKGIEDLDFEQIKSKIKSKEMGEKQQMYGKTKSDVEKLNKLVSQDLPVIEEEKRQIEALLTNIEGLLSATRGKLFKQLYNSANDVIAQESWTDENICPLCESELSHSIYELVSKELTQYEDVVEKVNQLNSKWLESNWREYIEALEVSELVSVQHADRRVFHFDSKFQNGVFSQEDLACALEWTERLTKMVTDALIIVQARMRELEKELPSDLITLSDKVIHAQQFKEAVFKFRSRTRELREVKVKLRIRQKWASFVLFAANMFSDAEENLSTTRISGIAAECKSHFREIMQVETVSPSLQRMRGQEDLLVQLDNFHGKSNLSASPVLSESYRNALAISVFLAAALKHSGMPRFVVMDDITSSFDSGHQFYLLELIRNRLQQPNNPAGLQFIILSHDGSLKKYFDSLNSSDTWSHMTLIGNSPMGIVRGNVESEDRIKKKLISFLDKGQLHDAELLIRQYLEFKLMQIIRKVNIPVPLDFSLSEGARSISRCFNAIEASVSLCRDAKKLTLDDRKLKDSSLFPVPIQIANLLSHYESGSKGNLSEPVLRGVVNSIDRFADCFKYSDDSDKSSSLKWRTSLTQKL